MLNKICLRAAEVAAEVDFPRLVSTILRRRIQGTPVCERHYKGGGLARYRKYQLTRTGKRELYLVEVVEGILIIDAKLYPLREVLFTYQTGHSSGVYTAIKKLLASELSFILGEPSLKARAARLQGRWQVEADGSKPAALVMQAYLLDQAYGVSAGWQALLSHQEDKLLVRQQRVKLRRLRSCFVFFKKLLPESQVYLWQRELKAAADSLSALRELDVAIMTCEKMCRHAEQSPQTAVTALGPVHLQQILLQRRQAEGVSFFQQQRLAEHTLKIARFCLWLQEHLPGCSEQKAGHYMKERAAAWAGSLQTLTTKYPDFYNMEDLHKIRIKVKRFRYVVQTLTLIEIDTTLIRKLKHLQDMLGFLHDDFVNAVWAKQILAEASQEEELLLEVTEFLGWQRAKAAAALESLPALWKEFLDSLADKFSL